MNKKYPTCLEEEPPCEKCPDRSCGRCQMIKRWYEAQKEFRELRGKSPISKEDREKEKLLESELDNLAFWL